MRYQNNAAYDLTKYQTKPEDQKLTVVKNRASAAHVAQTTIQLRVVLVAVALVAITSFIIYNNVVITEITSGITTAQKAYEELQSEQTRLKSELEGKISLKNVEEYAANTLGMAKIEKYQVEYISLSDGDKIEVSSENPSPNIFSMLLAKISAFLE